MSYRGYDFGDYMYMICSVLPADRYHVRLNSQLSMEVLKGVDQCYGIYIEREDGYSMST